MIEYLLAFSLFFNWFKDSINLSQGSITEITLKQGDGAVIEVNYFGSNDNPELICRGESQSYIKNENLLRFIVFSTYKVKQDFQCYLDDKLLLYINIKDGEFKTTHIKTPTRFTTISKKDLIRQKRDALIIKKIYTKSSNIKLNKKFRLPVNKAGYMISSEYGESIVNSSGEKTFHTGIDFVLKGDKDIYAVNRGEVVLSEDLQFCGKTVILSHGSDIFSTYCHLSKLSVNEGDFVNVGAKLGIVGNTGYSTAEHLHFVLRYHKSSINFKNFFGVLDKFFNLYT